MDPQIRVADDDWIANLDISHSAKVILQQCAFKLDWTSVHKIATTVLTADERSILALDCGGNEDRRVIFDRIADLRGWTLARTVVEGAFVLGIMHESTRILLSRELGYYGESNYVFEKPVWNPQTRELRFTKRLCKLRKNATNLLAVLQEFQLEQWRNCVVIPQMLRDNANQKAHQAVHKLNSRCKAIGLAFRIDDSRVYWRRISSNDK